MKLVQIINQNDLLVTSEYFVYSLPFFKIHQKLNIKSNICPKAILINILTITVY